MRHSVFPKLLISAAAGVLVAGAGAAFVLTRPVTPVVGADTRLTAELAARLSSETPETITLVAPKPVQGGGRPRQITVVPSRPAGNAGPRAKVPVLPPVQNASPEKSPVPTPVQRVGTPVSPPRDPLASLALVGITTRGDEEEAWLYDLEQKRQEVLEEGGQAFGFRLVDVGPESVTLSRDGQQFQLRLGEKAVPETAPAVSFASGDTGGGFGAPGGPGGFGGPGGMGGRGNRGGGFSGGQSFSGRGSFGRGGGNTGGSGGRTFGGWNASASSGSSARSSSRGGGMGGNNRSASSSGSRFGSTPSFSGRFTGGSTGGFSGGNRSLGGGGQTGTSAFSSAGAAAATSNPQTARRNGARLVGGGDAMPSPSAISNPQTQRRTGSNGTGAAFGQNQGTSANGTNRARTGSTATRR